MTAYPYKASREMWVCSGQIKLKMFKKRHAVNWCQDSATLCTDCELAPYCDGPVKYRRVEKFRP